MVSRISVCLVGYYKQCLERIPNVSADVQVHIKYLLTWGFGGAHYLVGHMSQRVLGIIGLSTM